MRSWYIYHYEHPRLIFYTGNHVIECFNNKIVHPGIPGWEAILSQESTTSKSVSKPETIFSAQDCCRCEVQIGKLTGIPRPLASSVHDWDTSKPGSQPLKRKSNVITYISPKQSCIDEKIVGVEFLLKWKISSESSARQLD